MGYPTAHTISVYGTDDQAMRKIIDKMKELGIIGYAVNEDLECESPVNWFSEEEDMLELSREFPDVRFEVHGEGDNQGDIWEDHFLNGMTYRSHAEITIPEFNPELLRKVNLEANGYGEP